MAIYLDHHATTPVDQRVLERMWPYFRDQFGNAASNHAYGWRAATAVKIARQQVADLLHVDPATVVFTSGATEANNLALKGVLRRSRPGSHTVATAIEHHAVLDPLKRLKRQGLPHTLVPVDKTGRVSPDDIRSAITPDTRIVSVMWANNEVGTLQPIAEISHICRERGILLHCDAAQAVGKVPVDLSQVEVDLLSFSGHKLYGPQGIGALIVRQTEPRIPLEPLLDGGGHEGRLRSGTLPVPLIVGLGAACELAATDLEQEQRRLEGLTQRLWQWLSARLPDLILNGPPLDSVGFPGKFPRNRLPNNLHVSVPDVDGTALLAALRDIAVSSGSACTTATSSPSHVLRAMGIPERLSLASLRFGLGRSTTDTEIQFAAAYVADVVTRLRGQK